jgi:hypothetical protein
MPSPFLSELAEIDALAAELCELSTHLRRVASALADRRKRLVNQTLNSLPNAYSVPDAHTLAHEHTRIHRRMARGNARRRRRS